MSQSRRSLAIATSMVLTAGPVLAQGSQGASAADEAAVAQAVDAMRAAMVSADARVLESLCAEQLSYGHSSARVENRAQFVENVASRRAPFKSITLSNQTIAISGDAAIVRHVFTAQQTSNGRDVDIRIGVLQVWQKQSGAWRLLARQAFTLPQT
ncbi:nuclear transport factor 2 family protein [Roseomonas chloroacetimidivorans]|uniref:nuclear transport factor 2 family protein n=1 Tax=Roseomonas chloroacetimidivorans TaxID=1766656 RepID=UPI003C77044A